MSQDVDSIFEDIERKVQDESYTREKIAQFLNEGLLSLANTLRPQTLTRIFISFQTIEGYDPTPLPEDLLFPHIFSVFDDNDDPIFFTTRLTDVDYTSKAIKPALVLAKDGAYLFPIDLRGMELRLTYVSRPKEISEDDWETDALDFLPEPYGRQALIAYACREMYGEIEDGIDGAMVNTGKHDEDFLKALANIQEIIGQGNLARRPTRALYDPFMRPRKHLYGNL